MSFDLKDVGNVKDVMNKKELLEIGVTDKYITDKDCTWQSYFRIKNQTFYCTQCENKEIAEWFAEQLKTALDQLINQVKEEERKRIEKMLKGSALSKFLIDSKEVK